MKSKGKYRIFVHRHDGGIFCKRFDTLSQLAKYSYEVVCNEKLSIYRLLEDLSCGEKRIFLEKYITLRRQN